MDKILLIDGNSILNRAFYAIMGSKMLMTKDGTYTNAVYGFLSAMFKALEQVDPKYLVVAFDTKTGANSRKEAYKGYKANRHGMPDELAMQMPILKKVLSAMNICVIELDDYEGDDILGTIAKRSVKQNCDVTILSGDRDLFQLAEKNITIRIPRTKMGKTEIEDFDEEKVKEIYGVLPAQLIEVKGLMGDSSDNIPGVPGVGEKTALNLISKYENIDKLYEKIEKNEDDIKGKARQNLIDNKELAILSRQLGTIKTNAPIKEELPDFEKKPWNNEEVTNIFSELNFHKFLERFSLEKVEEKENASIAEYSKIEESKIDKLLESVSKEKRFFFSLDTSEDDSKEKIINKKILGLGIATKINGDISYISIEQINKKLNEFKKIFEDPSIAKLGHKLSKDYVILRQEGISCSGFTYDAEVAAYDIDPTNVKYNLEELTDQYLGNSLKSQIEQIEKKTDTSQDQMTLFDSNKEKIENVDKTCIYVDAIRRLYEVTIKKLEEENALDLFNKVEMPLVEVLGDMQFNGMLVDKQELISFGDILKSRIKDITSKIYELSGEEFNINSTQQLGHVLFEKLNLPVLKKTKTGYATGEDILEKLIDEHPIIEMILEYRSLSKLNSTYVEGLIPCINEKTHRIHSSFHQTVTATGRISSTDPNLQNIPTRDELGKQLRKAFKPEKGYVYIDADYSQIELRVLAHISQDKNMLDAFIHDEDIHKQVASKVFEVPLESVTKEQRSRAKAVNFGIVYGITDYGLSQQINITKKEAKKYIDDYLEKYVGIKNFMEQIVEMTKEKGFVETLFHRRRYVPELKSNNYMVRQFGNRIAMNTPIQGTAADIMKIAMIKVYNRLKQERLDAKIVLQIHDELILEVKDEQSKIAEKLLKECMEDAMILSVPLKVEVEKANNWYDAK